MEREKGLIHPTAIVHDRAALGKNVAIGPYSIVGEHVTLEDDVRLESHVVIDGHTRIGTGTHIYPFASLGLAPQDLKYEGEPAELVIGKNNVIREHVTMNPGTKGGGMKTVIGDGGLFMVGVHIAHDCRVGDNVIMANNATLGGHVSVGEGALIGGLAAIHQFIRIGAYAVIGGMSGVESDVIPYGRVKGERAHLAGLNLVGLERAGVGRADIKTLQQALRAIFSGEGTLDERIEKTALRFADSPQVMQIIAFSREKDRFALCQPPKKAA